MRQSMLTLGICILAISCGDDSTTPGGGGAGASNAGGSGGTTADGGATNGGGGSNQGGDNLGGTGGTGEGGETQGGGSEGGSGGGSCEPITDDASHIQEDCTGNAPCPEGYTCQQADGIVLDEYCAILCTQDCECPADTLCVEQMDKGGSWTECR